MSLDTFGGIKAEVTARLARSDKAAVIPGFIQAAHSKMMKGHKRGRDWLIPPLRIDGMLTTTELTPSNGAATLPDTYLQMKRLTTDTAGARPLEYMPPEQFRASGLFTSSGVPQFYTIENRQLLIMPANTGVLSLYHYGLVTTPASDGDTNTIMETCPNAYLYGALAEAFAQIRNFEVAGYYEQEFAGAVSAANESEDLGQASGGLLVMRVGTPP